MKIRALIAVACGTAVLVVAGIVFRPGTSTPGESAQESAALAERDLTSKLNPESEDGAASRDRSSGLDSSPNTVSGAGVEDPSASETTTGQRLDPVPSTSPSDARGAPIDDFFADVLGHEDGTGEAFEMMSSRELQGRLAVETRDESWASQAERELRDYLARHPHISFYESVAVECRRTLCRVLATGDVAVLASIPGTRDGLADWQNMMLNLRHDSVWRHFSDSSMLFSGNKQYPGRTGIVTFLKRAGTRAASRK